ncbi:MAG: hypothetical protein ACOC95_03365 [Planctomycetota bacterium]
MAKVKSPPNTVMPIEALLRWLRISRPTLYKPAAEGERRTLKVARRWRFDGKVIGGCVSSGDPRGDVEGAERED